MDTYDPKCFVLYYYTCIIILFFSSKLWNTFKLNTDVILLNKLNNERLFSGSIPWLVTVYY